jgi:hypothetical protein
MSTAAGAAPAVVVSVATVAAIAATVASLPERRAAVLIGARASHHDTLVSSATKDATGAAACGVL